MCMQAKCPTCKLKSWYGCGSHIPSVMDSIPESERCTCTPKTTKNGVEYPPKAGTGSVEIKYDEL